MLLLSYCSFFHKKEKEKKEIEEAIVVSYKTRNEGWS